MKNNTIQGGSSPDSSPQTLMKVYVWVSMEATPVKPTGRHRGLVRRGVRASGEPVDKNLLRSLALCLSLHSLTNLL